MRVGIIALQHESNTFIQTPTMLADFRHDVLAEGEAVRARFADASHEVGGFFAGLAEAGIEAVPIFAARAVPGGTVEAETFQTLTARMFSQLAAAGPIDGLLVAPHGAGVCESHRDMDGYWLGLLRERVGPDLPMVCTLDAHANLSPRMVQSCHATIAYRTNPHVDQRQRGLEAARLLLRMLLEEVLPTQAACFVPMAINIERQHTPSEPCQSLYAVADRMLQQPGVLSNSVVLGFPYADVEEMGSSFLVVTDNDAALAQSLADQLGEHLLARRQEFVAQLIGVEEALDQAAQVRGPVCLLDMGDNVGGGSPADGTWIAQEVHRRGGPSCFVCLCDPAAAARAIAAGAGGRVSRLAMGGRVDPRHGPPLVAEVQVVSLHDGRFTENRVHHGGKTQYDMGPTAVVQTDTGLTLMLCSCRTPPFSLAQLTSCGIEPRDYQVLVAKGVQAPLAAYAPVCSHFIRVNTPGVTTADMCRLDYRYRRRPLFPFEPLAGPTVAAEPCR